MHILCQDIVKIKKQETKLRQDSVQLSADNTELYKETVTLHEALDRHDIDSSNRKQVNEALCADVIDLIFQ